MAGAQTGKGGRPERPLSPHLQIYSPQINMVMSILHRLTGAALYFGTLLVAWWLTAAATGPEYFRMVQNVLATWPMKVVLIGYTWAIVHHLLGGVRHLIWDTGRGLQVHQVNLLSWLNIAGSIGLTATIWLASIGLRGAL